MKKIYRISTFKIRIVLKCEILDVENFRFLLLQHFNNLSGYIIIGI